MNSKLKDHLWLWGQTAGSHNIISEIALPKQSYMTPIEGAQYLDIPNMCRVVYQGTPVYPYDQESASLVSMKNVVWSIADQESRGRKEDVESDINEVIRQAKMYSNVSGVVLDDFFARKAHLERYSTEDIKSYKKRILEGVGRDMDLWMVIYTRDLGEDTIPYLHLCDVITLWSWYAKSLPQMPDYMKELKNVAGPDKRYMVGCYMWDYGPTDQGAGQPIPKNLMEYQLDLYYKWLKTGYIDGVVFCSNCTADIGLETSDMVREWIKKYGNEEIIKS